MGANITTQLYNQTTTIQNSLTQLSNQKCSIVCVNDFSGNVIIIKGYTGDITIKQECVISNPTCALKTTFEGTLEAYIDRTIDQKETSLDGLLPSLSIKDTDQEIALSSLLQNTISQITNSTCEVSAISTMNNNYFYIENSTGNFTISQSGNISGASCFLDNMSKAAAKASDKTKATQASTTINIVALIVIAIVIGIVVFAVIKLSGKKGGAQNVVIKT